MPDASTMPGQRAARWNSGGFSPDGAGVAARSTRLGTPNTVTAATAENIAATTNVSVYRSSASTHSPMVGPRPMPPYTATEK